MGCGRYCIQKLISYDWKTGTETWKDTNYCNDNLSALFSFMGEDCRIIDTKSRREVDRNVDLETWR